MIAYNTLVVLLGTSILGACSGLVGSFAVLKRRSLTGDALAHAALPGLCVAFWVLGTRNLPAMLLGALISGIAGVTLISILTRSTRVKEDAAIGIVLSVFFGAGIVFSRVIQNQSTAGSKAGLDSYIFGKTAGMLAQDIYFMSGVALLSLVIILLLFKEFQLVSFDAGFAQTQGWPALKLDLLLMGLIALTVVLGLPAVGVVMMAAMLILPGAAARFWSERLSRMLIVSTALGAGVGFVGTLISARFSVLPTGPVIVLTGTVAFLLSMLLAPRRGVVARAVSRIQFGRDLQERKLLRVIYEEVEASGDACQTVRHNELPALKFWKVATLRATIGRLAAQGELERTADQQLRLTDAGVRRAVDVTRGYRLWELFLQDYPQWAASIADLGKESVDSVLSAEAIDRLTDKLRSQGRLPQARHFEVKEDS